MKTVATPVCYYLNSYRPLVFTDFGIGASSRYSIPPFVDGSIRREPDLEHAFPTITCLCRKGKFAPRLRTGDVIGYMTVKGKYGPVRHRHRRLTAVLGVEEVFESHADAAEWYRDRSLELPNNCLVEGNSPRPIEQSHKYSANCKGLCGAESLQRWDSAYWKRSTEFGTVVVCSKKFVDVSWNAPVISDASFLEAFGRIPATRNPGKLGKRGFEILMICLGIVW